MAQVKVQVAGGAQQEKDAATVGELRSQLGVDDNAQASVNGEPASDGYQLRKNDFVTFSKPVKAG